MKLSSKKSVNVGEFDPIRSSALRHCLECLSKAISIVSYHCPAATTLIDSKLGRAALLCFQII